VDKFSKQKRTFPKKFGTQSERKMAKEKAEMKMRTT
jgi:hypothetical protein